MELQKDALFINLMFDALRPLPGVDAAFIALKCKGRNRFNLRHSAFAHAMIQTASRPEKASTYTSHIGTRWQRGGMRPVGRV